MLDGCEGVVAVVVVRGTEASDRKATPGVVEVSGCGGSDPASKGRGSRIGEVGAVVDVATFVGPMLGVAKRPSSAGRDVAGGGEVIVPVAAVEGEADATASGLPLVDGVVERSGFEELPAVDAGNVEELASVANGDGGTFDAEGCGGVEEVTGGAYPAVGAPEPLAA